MSFLSFFRCGKKSAEDRPASNESAPKKASTLAQHSLVKAPAPAVEKVVVSADAINADVSDGCRIA